MNKHFLVTLNLTKHDTNKLSSSEDQLWKSFNIRVLGGAKSIPNLTILSYLLMFFHDRLIMGEFLSQLFAKFKLYFKFFIGWWAHHIGFFCFTYVLLCEVYLLYILKTKVY